MTSDDRLEIDLLKAQVRFLRETLVTVIAWVAQSAGSPLSRDDAKRLIQMAEQGSEGKEPTA